MRMHIKANPVTDSLLALEINQGICTKVSRAFPQLLPSIVRVHFSMPFKGNSCRTGAFLL